MTANQTHRQAMAEYFGSTVPRWEEFYTRQDRRVVYATIYRSRLETALSLAARLDLVPGSRCLDVGCGPGIASVALAQRGLVVTAIDIIKAQLDRTDKRAAEAGVAENVVTSVGDVSKLDFVDSTFDLILVIGVMEWQDDPKQALSEVARVLKPGGHAIISVDNKWALRNIIDPFMYRPFAIMRRSVGLALRWLGLRRASVGSPRDRSYSIPHFDRLVANAGLHKLEGATLGFGPFPFLDLEIPPSLGLAVHRTFQRLADRKAPLLRSPGLVYVVVAEKVQGLSPIQC